MNVRRSWTVFLLMLLTVACVLLLASETPILESVRALRGAPEDCRWQCIGLNSGDLAAAGGWKDGKAVLRYFTPEGKRLSLQHAALPRECEGGTLARVMPLRDGTAYLGVYGPDAEKLYLFRVGPGGGTECLLTAECAGASFAERTGRTRLSELALEEGTLSFALWTDDLLECYACGETGALKPLGTAQVRDSRVRSVLVDRNGALRQGGAGLLELDGVSADALAAGRIVTHLAPGRGGVHFLDGSTLESAFLPDNVEKVYRQLTLDTQRNGAAGRLTDAAFARDGSVLMLLDGSILTVTDAAGVRELRGVLRPAAAGQWLELAKYAGIALAAAALLWLVLCGLRRGYASLAALRGSVIVACAALCLALLRFAVLAPAARAAALEENGAVISAVLRGADAEERWDDEALAADAAGMLEAAMPGSSVSVAYAEKRDGVWRSRDGQNALLLAGFSPALADRAQAGGTAAELDRQGRRFVLAAGEHCLSVSALVSVRSDPMAFRLLLGGVTLMALLALLILATVGDDIRKISKQMETISRGSIPEQLELRTGDELESMASAVNSLGASIREQEEQRLSLERSYSRFVPEGVLDLLGKDSIREIDKSAFTVRRMAAMAVDFSFPETLYTDLSNSRLLFDSINEVIERCSAIVARKGGTIHHFAYFGFDAVMDDGGEAVSTAVAIQQEMLSFNEQRAHSGLPGVSLRIALDKGDVMIGIVGDTKKMTPTTVSASISTARSLTELCTRLKAGILCTESILSEHSDFGCRYMGKCMAGERPVRVYEVFDGDEFNTRRGKANSVGEFSKGVYDLYAGDAAGAKHTFLLLAHNYPQDGGVRYYLYLADRLEHDPSLPCLLEMENGAGGRTEKWP